MSDFQKCHDIRPEYIQLLSFSFCYQCISPFKSFEDFNLGFCVILWVELLSFIQFVYFSENSRLHMLWSSGLPGFSVVGNHYVIFCCSGSFVLRSSFRLVVISRSSSKVILSIAISTGYTWVALEWLRRTGQFVYSFLLNMEIPLYWLLWLLLFFQIFVDIEWQISRLAVYVNFSSGVTVPVVFHSEGWSTKAGIVFVVLGGFVKASSLTRVWGFAFVSVEAVLTCIVKCGKWMRSCVVSMTTLLFLLKCKPINFFITPKWSAKMLSPIPNLSVTVANGFYNCPIATCFWKLRGLSILRILLGAFWFFLCRSSLWAIALI